MPIKRILELLTTPPAPDDELESSGGPTARGVAAGRTDDLPEAAQRLEEVLDALERDPQRVTAALNDAIGLALDPAGMRKELEEARDLLDGGEAAVALLEARLAFDRARRRQLPPDFVDRHAAAPYRGAALDVDPYDSRFEDDGFAGRLAWLVQAAPWVVEPGPQAPLRSHDDPRWGGDDFTYAIQEPAPGEPVTVALFAELGTGLAPARLIAHQLAVEEPPLAVHLGGVYYTGTHEEMRANFEAPLSGLLRRGRTELFLLAGAPEARSGLHGTLALLDRNHDRVPHRQRGSYFCLMSERFQLVAPDTSGAGGGRPGRLTDDAMLGWLAARLREGRAAGRTNVLLTSHPPYRHASREHSPLLREDLAPLVREDLVDLWLFGGMRGCALWDRDETARFVGSAVGHGGYPYRRLAPDERQPAPQVWLETAPRYADTGVREDRGNHGYCLLDLHADGSAALRYIDWLGHERRSFTLRREKGRQCLGLIR